MQRYITWILALFIGLSLALSACKTAEDTSSLGDSKKDVKRKSLVDKDNTAQTMVELLRRQPLLTVSGSDSNPSIQIRGKSSFNTTTEPLFIVDGRRMGHEFASISGIAPADVERINVIRDPAELASYGVGAANGVIEISLRK